ncbi:tetratricopeptide repeat protein [Prochlorococcus sp. MIT 0801]|uniref:tetratricopeptide repeat protein n=1 Tax=Prochlorococcus sp. MIT 0801 TaxID=1501269 RepID=UPI001CEC646C|nr:tetratricopeptide repeat protein [Prochlorococcus sp. MIT 0801]
MKTSKIFQYLLSLSLIESFFIPNSSIAFFPKINEPNQQEFESTSIQIGKTAIQLIQFGQYKEAIKILKLALQLNPKEETLWMALAEAQLKSKDSDRALLSLDKALVINPKNASIYFTKGSIYMNSKHLKNAILMLKQGLFLDNKNETGYFQLGNAYFMLKEYTKALDTYNKVIKLNPNFWQVINNKGLILYEINKKKEAISKFKLAAKLSNNAEPRLALAISIYSTKGKSIESLNIAKNALIDNPQYADIEYQSEQLWGRKLQQSAKLFFKTKEMKKVVREAREKTQ